jgi:hypothetical protein
MFSSYVYLTYREGTNKITHPDDEDRFVTRYQRRHDAIQNRLRGPENKKEARMAGYFVSDLNLFLKHLIFTIKN